MASKFQAWITARTSAGALTVATDLLALVQGAVTKKITIANFIAGIVGTTAGTVTAGDDTRVTGAQTAAQVATAANAAQAAAIAASDPAGAAAAATGLRETSGPTTLVNGAIADASLLQRVGATLVGITYAALKTALGISSSSYTPTFSSVNANVTGQAANAAFVWTQIGNIVTIRGVALFNWTGGYVPGGSDLFDITLPVAPNATPLFAGGGGDGNAADLHAGLVGGVLVTLVSGKARCRVSQMWPANAYQLDLAISYST